MAARVYDALQATGSLSGFYAAKYMPPSSGHKFLNPDVAKALDILEEALEDGRPLPPIIITPLLRRLSRHRDPAHMVRAFHLMLAAGHAPHPPHYALGLICFGMAAHAPGLHLMTSLLSEYPGRIPAPLYSRLVTAQLACGQYDRALRLLGSMRTMAGLTSPSALAGSSAPVSDLGPVLWAALDCIANMFPSFPRGTDSLAERHEKADTASTRGRAAAEVLMKHYAIAVVPSAGEANALLGFLCHGSISSPYTNFADDERHRRFAASMLWHRDFGLNPKRTVTVDPASIAVLPPPIVPPKRAGKNVPPPAAAEAVGAEADGSPSAAKSEASDWNDRWATDGPPESSSDSSEDSGGPSGPLLAVRRRWLAGSPSDHAAWMELLAHALCCKQIVDAAERSVLNRCLEALAEHMGPMGLHTQHELHKNDLARQRERPMVVAPDSNRGLAGLTLAELAAGHVSTPYWAVGRDLGATIWRPQMLGTSGPAGYPDAAADAATLPLSAVVRDEDLCEGSARTLPPSPAHLASLRQRVPAVRMALAAQGYAAPITAPPLQNAAIASGAASRVVLLGPAFASLGPSDYDSAWSSPRKLTRALQGERLTRIIAGLYVHLAALDAQGRPPMDAAAYSSHGPQGLPVTTTPVLPSHYDKDGTGLRMRWRSHDLVLSALVHRQKVAAAGNVAVHMMCLQSKPPGGPGSIAPQARAHGNAYAALGLAHGIFHLLPHVPTVEKAVDPEAGRSEAERHIRYIFRTAWGDSTHTIQHAAKQAYFDSRAERSGAAYRASAGATSSRGEAQAAWEAAPPVPSFPLPLVEVLLTLDADINSAHRPQRVDSRVVAPAGPGGGKAACEGL